MKLIATKEAAGQCQVADLKESPSPAVKDKLPHAKKIEVMLFGVTFFYYHGLEV
jgi:hypothetical protein